ncbi:MAG: 2-oxoacid:ferredoxin oxidoreductase subunit beta [candidate division Zixibacteria bacterium 4484_95]|nr:MAG: 2-oxoacid:ferredoxin oxidoreductase subunit beta [candidate division Zixibacteria bacterium 4484_95]RKX19897.1 MAG: 2-oxoacid:ferredoxin oxidoreductase subunit beta [candidate division Zixibacteria bacterium]
MQKSDVTHQYLRHTMEFPNVWCPGCGIGIVLGAFIRAVDRLHISKDDLALVSGIGCTARIPAYVDFNTLHTTHGRPIAFATGVKLANPKLKVVVISGDGDILAIGGNHFIHACRRNIDITVVVVNNYIYGMTGGQYSPTTPMGKRASTAPYLTVEPPFDTCNLAISSGATFVARSTVYHATQLSSLIEKALVKKGFSVVEAMSNCHTQYGRLNREGTAVRMIQAFKNVAVPVSTAAKLSPEKLEGKIVIGVLHDIERPEYIEHYQKIIDRLQLPKMADKEEKE